MMVVGQHCRPCNVHRELLNTTYAAVGQYWRNIGQATDSKWNNVIKCHSFLSFQIGLKTPKLMQLEVKIGFFLTTHSKGSKDSHNEGSSFP